MSMKRIICFLILLLCLSFSAFAVPKTDGRIGPREYEETLSILQIPKNESNNHLEYAYLHWVVSPENRSVYLGIQYRCSDYGLEEDKSAVRVFVNEELIGTVLADGTVEGVDHDRFELDAVYDDGDAVSHDANCEVRVGIKFWKETDITAGFQVLDFSGNPSNYYEQLVYAPYTTTTRADETTKQPKTTTEKDTTYKTTTAAATETTVRAPRTTAPVITASPKRETTPAALVSVLPSTTGPTKETTTKAVKAKTTKPKTTKAPASESAKTTAPSTSEPTTTAADAAEVVPATTATTTSPAIAAVSGAQMYSELNKVKIVGTVLVVMILTAAILSTVFLGMRRKNEPDKPHTPQEEYDDFG